MSFATVPEARAEHVGGISWGVRRGELWLVNPEGRRWTAGLSFAATVTDRINAGTFGYARGLRFGPMVTP